MIYIRQPTAKKIDLEELERELTDVYKSSYIAYEFGGVYTDTVDTAATAFAYRPNAIKVLVEAQRGDLVIFKNFELAFAGMFDMHSVLNKWYLKGVSTYFKHIDMACSRDDNGAYVFLSELVEFENKLKDWKCPVEATNETLWGIICPLREKGFKSAEIAKKLNEQGLRNSSGQKWNANSVRAWYSRTARDRKGSIYEPILGPYDAQKEPAFPLPVNDEAV